MENIQRFEHITFWFAPVYSVNEKSLLGIFRADCMYTLCDIQCINTVINYSYHAVYRLHYYMECACTLHCQESASIVCNLCRGEESADQWTNISLATAIRVQRRCYLYVDVSLKDVLTSLLSVNH